MLMNINLDALFPGRGRKAYEKRFAHNTSENLFFGSFASLEDAAAAAPPNLAVGYENSGGATTLYSPQVTAWDYPAIHWVADSFSNGMTSLFDLGGHIGIKYYAFKRVLHYPERLQWTVCDVPHVARAGEELAQVRSVESELRFCTDMRLASGNDVLFMSGSLQYLPSTMKEILQELRTLPRRIILNTTAVHAQRTLYTLNSIGVGVCPYRIQHHEEVLKEIRDLGYRRRDVWRNDGKPIFIPFVEGGDGAYYFGCCFDRL